MLGIDSIFQSIFSLLGGAFIEQLLAAFTGLFSGILGQAPV